MILELSKVEASTFSETFAHFLTRTSVSYATDEASTLLKDRGIENRLLDSLVAGLPKGAIIAGGFMTGVLLEETTAKDIDLFFVSSQAFVDTVNLLLNPPSAEEDGDLWAWQGYELLGGQQSLDNVNACRFLTFKHKGGKRPDIQCLRMVWYEDAAHVIDSFDYTITQFALTNTDGKVILTYRPSAWMDLARKRIVLHRLQFASSSLRRLIKYAAKGFYACPGSLQRICEEIQAFKGPSEANQIVYVD